MRDRGMIKWAPFNSVINNKALVNSLIKEKSKITKPIKSQEEIQELEDKIIDAYFTKSSVNITYYQDGNLINIKGYIKKIDQVYKMVYLDNNIRLLFKQIISIS